MSGAVKTVTAALKKSVGNNSGVSNLASKLSASNLYGQSTVPVSNIKTSEGKFSQNNATFIDREDISDEELKRQAELFAKNEYIVDVTNTKASADKKINTLNKQLQEKVLKGQTDLAELENDYSDSTESIKDTAVRNGMVNSSVFAGLNSAAMGYFDAQRTAIEQQLAIAQQSITTEIEIVTASKEAALLEYDLKQAAAYEKKLTQLKSEELKAREEVIAFNRKVAELENNYEKNRARTLEEWEKARAEGKI